MDFKVFMYKWKLFEGKLKNHTDIAQTGIVGKVPILVSKHFTHRVYDRIPSEEYTVVRRTLYHTVNKHLGEVLYWWYANLGNELLLKRDNICIVLNRSNDDAHIVVRTIFKTKKAGHKYHVINL